MVVVAVAITVVAVLAVAIAVVAVVAVAITVVAVVAVARTVVAVVEIQQRGILEAGSGVRCYTDCQLYSCRKLESSSQHFLRTKIALE